MNFQKVRLLFFEKLKSIWLILLIGAITALLYSLGSYYESETDLFFIPYAKGWLTNKPLALPETYNVQILIGYLISYLYAHYPNQEWYDWLTFFTTLCIGFLLFKVYDKLNGIISGNGFLRIVVACFFIALFVSVALIPELARLPFLIASCVFIIIFLRLIYPEKVPSALLVLCYIMFLFSMLRRIEPAMALTFLFGWYLAMLLIQKKAKAISALKLFLPCVILVIVVHAYIHIPRTPEGVRYLKIMPYENGIADFKSNPSDLHLVSREDSIKYYSASRFFFCDTKNLNREFFNKIGIVPLDKSPLYLFNYLERTSILKERWEMLIKDINENENWLFALAVLINLMWLYSGFKTSLKEGISGLLFTGIFWLGFLFPNLFMKVETKVNESLLIFLVLILLVHFIVFELCQGKKTVALIIAFSIVAAILLKSITFGRLYTTRKNDAVYVNKVRDVIDLSVSKSLLILNISCWDRISIKLFDYDHWNSNKKYISFDNGILYLYDEYNDYMKQVTGETEFIRQVDFVVHKQDAKWMSSDERIKMIIEYINDIYGKHYKYRLINRIGREASAKYKTPIIGVYQVTEEGKLL